MKYKKGDLFIGKKTTRPNVVVIAIEDTRSGGYNQTLCRFMNCPDEPEKVGTTAFFAHWALRDFYDKVEA
jgi:hypothetical protein